MTAVRIDIAVDNDIVMKAVAYGVTEALWQRPGPRLAILGVARFVIPSLLDRMGLATGPRRAKSDLEALLATADELNPSPTETRLAAEIEAAAQQAGVQFDIGESQLCAMAMERMIPSVETGDKRAIRSLEVLRGRADDIERLDGRIRCLEQVMHSALEVGGRFQDIATAVCREPMVDKALTFCFACSTGTASLDGVRAGLQSYIANLRTVAPNILGSA